MDYQKEFIVDFAKRTLANLEFIEGIKNSDPKEIKQPHEVTQLFNSMLGLLVFPQQRYMDQIPKTPLSDLEKSGWPKIKVTRGYADHSNLQQLIRMMRNAVSHCNVSFIADEDKQLTGLKLWNHEGGNKNRPINWEVELPIQDLRNIALQFIGLIQSQQNSNEAV